MPKPPLLDIDVITIFPELIETWASVGMVGIAVDSRIVKIRIVNPRDFTTDRHRSIDDRPYGGGPGMVMMCGPLFEAVESIGLEPDKRNDDEQLILLTPAGEPFNQAMARELAGVKRIGFICGRYEGIDERVVEGLKPREVSIGDYVLSGGELAAKVIAEAVVRLLPGVLGEPESLVNESFEGGLLDYPQYTRPEEFRGMSLNGSLSSFSSEGDPPLERSSQLWMKRELSYRRNPAFPHDPG